MKSVQDAASPIDFSDASMINWLSKKGLCEALEYHGKDLLELKSFDMYHKVVLSCNHLKPSNIWVIF